MKREFSAIKQPPVILVSPNIEKKGDEFGDVSTSLSETYQQALMRAGAHQGLLVRFGKAGGHIAELIAFFFDIWRNQDYRRLFYRRKLTFHSIELSRSEDRR